MIGMQECTRKKTNDSPPLPVPRIEKDDELVTTTITHSSSPQSTATLVVPSPTSSSWTRAMSTRTFAAALSRLIDFSIVAPSFVTLTLWSCSEIRCSILSIPLGPRVVLTRSAMAMAPMNDDRRAFSPCLPAINR